MKSINRHAQGGFSFEIPANFGKIKALHLLFSTQHSLNRKLMGNMCTIHILKEIQILSTGTK